MKITRFISSRTSTDTMPNWRKSSLRAIRIRDEKTDTTSAARGPHPHVRNPIWRSSRRRRDGAQGRRRASSMILLPASGCRSLSLAYANCEGPRRDHECAEIRCSKRNGTRKQCQSHRLDGLTSHQDRAANRKHGDRRPEPRPCDDRGGNDLVRPTPRGRTRLHGGKRYRDVRLCECGKGAA